MSHLVVSHLVVVEVARCCKSLSTNATLVRLLSAVNSPAIEASVVSIYSFLRLLTHLCVLRLELVEKPLLQMLQMCGFSPVCLSR